MLTNEQMFNQLVGAYGNAENQTAPATLSKLKSIGFQGVSHADIQTQADWVALTLQFMLINLQVGQVKNVFQDNSFGETFGLENGGIAQKILMDPASTINPGWTGLKDGDSPDQFVFLDSGASERLWKHNFDYAAAISIRDDFFRKQVFANQYGMNLFAQGQMTSLQNAFTEQGYWNIIMRLNEILNSTDHALKDTQKVQTTISSDDPTNEQTIEFAKSIRKVIQAMCDLGPATDAFNSYGFRTTQDKASLHLITRPGYKTALEFTLPQINHYPVDPLEGLNIIEVEDFGGLKYYKEEAHTTEVYPGKDSLGRRVEGKWSTTEDGKTIDESITEVFTVDPNENVIAILADTGVVFDCQQNPYSVEPARNARGKFTTFWAGRPNEILGIDNAHNVVAFYKSTGQT